MAEHLPECEKAWDYADAMSGRGIEPADCWLCYLIARVRADERERIQSEALDAITMHVLTGEDRAAFLYRLDRILNPEWKP